MNFEECKEYLFNFYSKNGFTKVVINSATTWMLKNENNNEAYISLTNKDESLKLDLFNVEASFKLEDLVDVAIIENINKEIKVLNIANNKELINKRTDLERLKIRNQEKKDFFVTTETSIDLPIEKRIEVISAQRIYGINLIKDIFALIRDIVGGRVNSLETALNTAHDEIIIDLKEKAYQYGGNAIIGLKVEHTYNNSNNGSILSVYATGTVVKLKIQDNRK